MFNRQFAARLLHGPWPWLAVASLAGWAAMLGAPAQLMLPAFCGSVASRVSDGLWSAWTLALTFDPQGLLVAWLLMLLAMMPLLLGGPLVYLWKRSLRRRRPWAIGLFLLSYCLVWTAAGVLIALLSVTAQLLGSDSPWLMLGLVFVLCMLWQASPAKQHCLNNCHYPPRISAFGWPMLRDCLRYGLTNGFWCIGACWPAMLLPSLVQQGHSLLMLACMVWLAYERLLPARKARWRWPLPGGQRLADALAPRLTKYLSSRCKSLASRVPAR